MDQTRVLRTLDSQIAARFARGLCMVLAIMTPEQFLSRFNVKCFWHFTDERNLETIRAAGALLSLSEAKRRDLNIPAPGGNQWSHEADQRLGLDNYVHLCLADQHPMEFRAREDGRIVNTRFLSISRDVLKIAGVRFAPDVANKRGTPLLTLSEACECMDFQVIYDRTDWRDPAIQQRRTLAKRYELLVPKEVPIALIKGA